MKAYKKILIIATYCSLLTITNCFASTIENQSIIKEKEGNFVYTEIAINSESDNEFINNIEQSIEIDNNIYEFYSISKSGGEQVTNEISINTSKTIKTDTNNKEKIANELGRTIDYEENGYIGTYNLDIDNMKIQSHYNGYTEHLIEETKEYNNLPRNDLDFVEKQITKDGLTLNLLKTSWEVEKTKLIGNTDVADTYKAICYYAGKIRIDNPLTYTISANYYGTATKTEIMPIKYTIKYKKLEKEKTNNVIPIIATTVGGTSLIVVIFFITRKNTKIYNLKDGKWALVGKTLIKQKNPKINLNKYKHLETTNKYKIELSKNAVNKVSGKFIEISKDNRKIKHIVNEKDKIVSFEINM